MYGKETKGGMMDTIDQYVREVLIGASDEEWISVPAGTLREMLSIIDGEQDEAICPQCGHDHGNDLWWSICDSCGVAR